MSMGLKSILARLLGLGKKEEVKHVELSTLISNDKIAVVSEEGDPVPHACGHTAPPNVHLICYGSKIFTEKAWAQKAELCAACQVEVLKKVAIRCGNCGFAILPGTPVAKYPDGPLLKRRWSRVVMPDGGVIGCLNEGCCPDGSYFVGTWDGNDVAAAFPEGRTQAEEVMATGDTIYISVTPDGIKITRIKR